MNSITGFLPTLKGGNCLSRREGDDGVLLETNPTLDLLEKLGFYDDDRSIYPVICEFNVILGFTDLGVSKYKYQWIFQQTLHEDIEIQLSVSCNRNRGRDGGYDVRSVPV